MGVGFALCLCVCVCVLSVVFVVCASCIVVVEPKLLL